MGRNRARHNTTSAHQDQSTQLSTNVATVEDIERLVRELPPNDRHRLVAGVLRTAMKDSRMDDVVELFSREDARALVVATVSRHFGTDYQKEFDDIDKDRSGTLSKAEFRRYLVDVVSRHAQGDAQQPTNRQLMLYAMNSAIPMIVFGCLDNSIMIVGGDVVDDLIGSTFKLSTLACAALANTFADVFGISIGNTVEAFTGKMGLPKAELTAAQASLPVVRRVGMAGASSGILVGCILGMSPLLVMNVENKYEE